MGTRTRFVTENEATVLRACQLDARASTSDLAKSTGLREHSVRYALQGLMERKVIVPFALINVHALGYIDFCLFFNRAPDSKVSHKRIAEVLKRSKQVAWFASLGGRYQYTASIFAKSVREIDHSLWEIVRQCGGAMSDKSIAIRESWTSYPAKYLGPRGVGPARLIRGQLDRLVTLDGMDMKILREVVKNPLASSATLARAVGVPSTTLGYRVRNLEQQGVIAGYLYYINGSLIGRHLFRLLLSLRTARQGFVSELSEFCEVHPDITGLVRCLGNWDFEINLEVAHPQHIEAIVDQITEKFSDDVRGIETLSVLETSKICLYPF